MQCLFAHYIFKGIAYPKIHFVIICSHSKSIQFYYMENSISRFVFHRRKTIIQVWNDSFFIVWGTIPLNHFDWCPQVGIERELISSQFQIQKRNLISFIHFSRNPQFEVQTQEKYTVCQELILLSDLWQLSTTLY